MVALVYARDGRRRERRGSVQYKLTAQNSVFLLHHIYIYRTFDTKQATCVGPLYHMKLYRPTVYTVIKYSICTGIEIVLVFFPPLFLKVRVFIPRCV